MALKALVRIDRNQGAKETHFLTCPQCGQKLTDIEECKGMAVMRTKCRRCGTYVKIELEGK